MKDMLKRFRGAVFVIIILCACTAVSPSSPPSTYPSPTETPYVPHLVGTPLPVVYERITVENAASVVLLAQWDTIYLYRSRIAFTPDGAFLLMGIQDQLTRSWQVTNGEPIDNLPGNYAIDFSGHEPGRSISPDGRFEASTSLSGISINNLNRPLTRVFYYLDDAVDVLFLKDGEHLAVAIKDGRILFVPTSSWEERLLEMEDEHTYSTVGFETYLEIDTGIVPQEMAISPDGTTLALFFRDGALQFWDLSSLSLIAEREIDVPVVNYAFAPDGTILALVSRGRPVLLLDSRSGTTILELDNQDTNMASLAFSPDGRLLASLDYKNGIFLWGILPEINPLAARNTATAIALTPFEPTHSLVSLPDPTLTPTSGLPTYSAFVPLPWPVQMPTEEQIEEARACEIESLAKTLYPETLDFWQLEASYAPQNACDWATLAYAYADRVDAARSLPEEGKRAFFQAFMLNPAITFTMPIFYLYFDSLDLVGAPGFTDQPITAIAINYEWNGMAEQPNISYHIEITQANLSADEMKTDVQVEPEGFASPLTSSLDSETVQAFGTALVDFLPVQSPIALIPCSDNYPDWTVDLTFLDGTRATLKTYESNFLGLGGPWQTKIDGQNYIQYSAAFGEPIWNLFKALGLPFGTPMATTCGQFDIFSMVFP